MTQSPHFNPEKPYQSIVDFTNRGDLLLTEQKKEFFESIENFFAERAFYDRSFPINDPARFALFDAPKLLAVAKKLGLEKKEARFNQLLANISKVSGTSFHKAFNIYEVIVSGEENNNEIVFWGWIEGKYLEGSKKLGNHLKDGKLFLKINEIEPSTLLALQRFQEFLRKKSEPKIDVDLTFEMLFDLVIFADEWEIDPLKVELREFFTLMAWSSEETAEFELAKEQYNPEKIDKALIALKINNLSLNNAQSPTIILPYYEDGKVGSHWFIEKDPYGSIVRFTGRCCTLPKAEQLRFFSSVRFFFTKAYEDSTTEIPENLKRKFARTALPFLLKTMQHKEEERKRFLASVEIVTKQIFPNLSPRDQVQITQTGYGQINNIDPRIGWVIVEKGKEAIPEIAPLKIKELNEKTSLDAYLLPNASSSDVISSYLLSLKHKLPEDRKKIGNIIVERLQKPTSDEISTLLVKYLELEEIRTIILVAGISHFNPKVQEFGLMELTTLFSFFLKNKTKEPLSNLINEYLAPTAHVFAVLDKFAANFSEMQKKEIATYCYNKMLDMIPNTLRDGYKEPQRIFVKRILAEFKKSDSIYEKEEKRIGHIKLQKEYFKLIDDDFHTLYTFLKRSDVIELAKRGGGEKEYQWLLEGMVGSQPELIIVTYAESFILKFFPDHQGKKDSPILKAMNAMMESCIRSEFYYPDKQKALIKNYPLSKEEIIAIHNVIFSDEGNKWLENKKGIGAYYFKQVLSAYHTKEMVLKDSLKKVFEENASLSENSKSFVMSLAIEPKHVLENNDLEVLEEAITEFSLSSQDSSLILGLLKHKDIQAAFEKLYGERYALSLQLMERFADAKTFANDFFKEFKLNLRTPYDKERESYENFLKQIVASVYRFKGKIDFATIRACGKHVYYDNEPYVEFYRLLNNEKVKEWTRTHGGDFMVNALIKSLEAGTIDRLKYYVEIRNLMDTFRERKILDEGFFAFTFLEDNLRDLLRKNIKDLENKDKLERFKQDVQSNAKRDKINLADVKKIQQALNEEELTKNITQENFSKKLELFKNALSEVKITESEDSKKNEDGCSIT